MNKSNKNEKKLKANQNQYILLLSLKKRFLIMALLAFFFIAITTIVLSILASSINILKTEHTLILSLMICNIVSIILATSFLVWITILKGKNILLKYKSTLKIAFLLFWMSLLLGMIPNLLGFVIISKGDAVNYNSMYFNKLWYENWMKVILLLTFDVVVLLSSVIVLFETMKMSLIKQNREDWMNSGTRKNENNIIQLITTINPNYTGKEMNNVKRFTIKYIALNISLKAACIVAIVLINIFMRGTIFYLFQWLPISILVAQLLFDLYTYLIQFQVAKEKSKNILQKNINIFSHVVDLKDLKILNTENENEEPSSKAATMTTLFKENNVKQQKLIHEETVSVKIDDLNFCISHKIWTKKSMIAISYDKQQKSQLNNTSLRFWLSEILSPEIRSKVITEDISIGEKNFVVKEMEFSERKFTEFDKKIYFLVGIIASKIFNINLEDDNNEKNNQAKEIDVNTNVEKPVAVSAE
ncbi:hypothetical protein [Mycoplasma todarodis]|uniref:Uncharacterized protein n=1 Tax=Mycoplasma todarodis TaxID=1937191 RepID=A0A4R0XMV3_9MOLU|nr:hypothetical protein [Mycoplasma todarodis]TCG12064.1 hypothetical protein C4B25_00015 [Mycoplasma todarodis]